MSGVQEIEKQTEMPNSERYNNLLVLFVYMKLKLNMPLLEFRHTEKI